MLKYIAMLRFPNEPLEESLSKVRELSKIGPFSAFEGVRSGLLTGTCYKGEVLDAMFPKDSEGKSTKSVKGFYHYASILERFSAALKKGVVDVGIVYLTGNIGSGGE